MNRLIKKNAMKEQEEMPLMKKKIKKLCAALLCVLLLTGLGACAKEFVPDKTPDSQEKNTSDSTPETKTGKRVYFAAPMFNQSEKDYNLKLTAVLEEFGYEVFLPQRDGIEAAKLEGKTEQELIDMIFPLDVEEVLKADILFMNMDGRVPDEGACVELGIGYANGKRCYGFKTDTRTIELGMDLNPMIAGCMIEIFRDFDGDRMIEQLRSYLENHDL